MNDVPACLPAWSHLLTGTGHGPIHGRCERPASDHGDGPLPLPPLTTIRPLRCLPVCPLSSSLRRRRRRRASVTSLFSVSACIFSSLLVLLFSGPPDNDPRRMPRLLFLFSVHRSPLWSGSEACCFSEPVPVCLGLGQARLHIGGQGQRIDPTASAHYAQSCA